MVLSGAYGTTNLTALPTLDTSSLAPDATTPQQFTATADGARVTLLPFYKMHHQRYTVYWMTPGAPPPVFVAWYRFDETTGTRAADAPGSGRTATLAGAASWAAGRLGGSVVLDGATGHVQLPSGILSGVNDLTVAAFVRLDTTASWRRLFDFGTGTTANMFLVPRSGSNTTRFAITTGGAGAEQRIEAPALPTGVWKHVAVTLSGGVGILYVDGAEVARNSAMTLRPSSLGSTNQNWIGRSQYASDPFLDGQVDDLRLYSRALAAPEIAALSAQT